MTASPDEPNGPPVPPPYQLQELAEQVRIQYRNLPTACIGSVVMSTLLLAIIHGAVDGVVAAVWLLLMYLQAATRYLQGRAYWKAEPEAIDASRWGRYAAWGSGASGALWGLGSIVLFPYGVTEFQLILLFVLIGMGSASVYASASYMPAFHAYLTPAVAPVGLMMLREGDSVHMVLAAMTIFYIPVTMRFAYNLNRSFRESIALRFENLGLIAKLREQTEMAERANTAKSRFLAAASHDLRQPMHALTLFVEILRRGDLAPSQRTTVNHVVRAVTALDGLFEALLDMSRLDAGLVQTTAEHFSLNELLDRIRAEYTPVAQAKGLRLRVAQSNVVVVSDRQSLERIVRNLVENAVRYTENGSVLIGCRRRGNTVVLQVCDTGPGIPADKRAEVFVEFYQMGNDERDRRKGLGLGLAIVDRLCKVLGHEIRLESQPGRGSVFSVTVPQGDPGQCQAAPDTDAVQIEVGFDRELIAVVDDDPHIREGTRELLVRWNCEVVVAEGGDALRAALATTRKPPSVLICDYRLRDGETGLDVIAAMRDEFNCDIPALLITGDSDARLRAVESDSLFVLHKPLAPARLRAAITRLLQIGAAVEDR